MSSETGRWSGPLVPDGPSRWRIPKSYDPRMRVDGVLYSSEALLSGTLADQAPQQVANVAMLPGIVGASFGMPDLHWGYGFAIGGVAAFDLDAGVVSPGGVGYDINCGVRLMASRLTREEATPKLPELISELYRQVPSGVGSEGRIKLTARDLDRVLAKGAAWAVAQGYGRPEDLERTEDNGRLPRGEQARLSARARERGGPQLGTLGSGNHFLEVQAVDEIFDPDLARRFGLEPGTVAVMVHCGSRGLGYQVCDDFLKVFRAAAPRFGIPLPDPQLACAPIRSPEGQDYLAAMAAAANYAWANRQCILHWVRESFERVFRAGAGSLGLDLVYDVAHNIAKLETHDVGGRARELCVHRKGATRAFPPGHPALGERFRDTGQPVLIPGSMGTASYVCAGAPAAQAGTFASTAHGAGRVLSRHAAVRKMRGRSVVQELGAAGIQVQARELKTLAEEAPEAYKDVEAVVDVVTRAGLARPVARLKPLGVVKG